MGNVTGDKLKISQDRRFLLLPRFGIRWLKGQNSLEIGGEVGKEIHALAGYRFVTNGAEVECRANANETFAACIKRFSKGSNPSITPNSVTSAITETRRQTGLYSKVSFSVPIPFTTKVKYQVDETGSFFFNAHDDNSTDTRYLINTKHSLKFAIWPSFSIGPTLQVINYRDKVGHSSLVQTTFGFDASVSFDIFNRREKAVQLRNKYVAAGSQ